MNARRAGRLRLAHSAGRGRPARFRCTQTFGLTAVELRAEIRRLASSGWMTWEIAYRFGCTSCEDTA